MNRNKKKSFAAVLLLSGVFALGACNAAPSPTSSSSSAQSTAPAQETALAKENVKEKAMKIKSKYSMEETVKKIEEFLASKNLTLFYVADHQANAQGVGLSMPPTKVLSFGDPKVGTLLMQDNPEISFELPLRLSVFQEGDDVFITYKAPSSFASSYTLGEKSLEILGKMDDLYKAISSTVE